jgi:hypothetical protein
VELNPPAKKPYVMEKMTRRAMAVCDDSESGDDTIPQNKRTDNAEPTEDSSMMFVTENRSQSTPKAIPPMIEVALNNETSIVPVFWDKPTVVVEKEGRNVVGKKYPKLWITFPICSIQNVVCLRKLRSKRRAEVDCDIGIRGFMNGKAMRVVIS